MRHYFDTVLNEATGRPLIGAQVLVLEQADQGEPAGAVATIYADFNGTPLANPLTVEGADSASPGLYEFYAADGFYTIQYLYLNQPIRTIANVDISADVTAAQLAGSGGAALVGFTQSGTGSVTRTVQGRLRDTMSLADKGTTADMLTALTRVFTDLAAGGTCRIPRGTWILSDTAQFTGTRLKLVGDGEQSTIVSFTGDGVAIQYLRTGGSAASGVEQCEIGGMSFLSAVSATKTAIECNNIANGEIHHIGIAGIAAWPGTDSIGIRTTGRQYLDIHHNDLACARPLVIGNNTVYPSLAADHFEIRSTNFTGTSGDYACIEFEDGTTFSNTSIRKCGFAGGKDAILYANTTNATASVNFSIIGCRSEQAEDASGYFANLTSTSGLIQNILIDDCQIGPDRNGIKIRNGRNVTIRNTQFNQTGKTAIDMTFVAGSRLEIINCVGAGAGTFTNARCVEKSSLGRNLGFSETWVYDADSSSGALQYDTPLGGVPFALGGGTVSAVTKANPAVVTTSAAHGFSVGDVASFSGVGGMTELNGNSYTVGTVPTSTTFSLSATDSSGFTIFTTGGTAGGVKKITDDSFAGYVDFVSIEDVGARFFLRGGTHSVSERDDPDNFFSVTKDQATTVNVYWGTTGPLGSCYKLQNNRAAPVTYAPLRLGSNIGA